MADYISRETAIELLHYNSDESCASVVSDFEAIPAADVEPVRHGLWEIRRQPDWPRWAVRIVCSRCGLVTGQKSKYCPSCGAKMDLEVSNAID